MTRMLAIIFGVAAVAAVPDAKMKITQTQSQLSRRLRSARLPRKLAGHGGHEMPEACVEACPKIHSTAEWMVNMGDNMPMSCLCSRKDEVQCVKDNLAICGLANDTGAVEHINMVAGMNDCMCDGGACPGAVCLENMEGVSEDDMDTICPMFRDILCLKTSDTCESLYSTMGMDGPDGLDNDTISMVLDMCSLGTYDTSSTCESKCGPKTSHAGHAAPSLLLVLALARLQF